MYSAQEVEARSWRHKRLSCDSFYLAAAERVSGGECPDGEADAPVTSVAAAGGGSWPEVRSSATLSLDST